MTSFTSTQDKKMSANATPLLGFDFGTTKSAVSYSIHGKVELVPLSKARTNRYESAAVVSYDANGQFIHGEALLKLVDSGKVEAVDVLRHFKLLMRHPRDGCAECVAFERLARKWEKSLDDIIFDYFVALLTQAINHLRKTVYINVDFSTFDVCLTTPSMWPPAANRLLSRAAKHAGARTSVLYPETLASALCIVQEEILDQPDAVELPFENGDLIVVCDCGGGTADMVLFEICIKPGSTTNADHQLRLVRPTTGQLSGGSRVDEAFINFLQRRGTKAALALEASRAGFTVPEYLTRMAIKFERSSKRDFEGDEGVPFLVSINGRTPEHDLVMARLTCQDMKSFFDPVLDDIITQVRETVGNTDDLDNPRRLKNIVLTGGFGSSSYVSTKLEETFPRVSLLTPSTAYQSPVAKGALFRHTSSTLLTVGTGWSLGLVRDEYFDPQLHPDAYTVLRKRGRGKRRGRGKTTIVHDHAVVKKDYTFSGEALVEDRLSYILDGTKRTVKVIWSDRYPHWVNDHDPIVLEQDVWMTTKSDPRDHEPLYKKGTYEVLPCFERFETVTKVIENPKEAGFVTSVDAIGKKVWVMRTCMELRFKGHTIELRLVVRNGATLAEAEDVKEIPIDEYVTIKSQDDDDSSWNQIYDESFDHVSREAGGSAPFAPQQEQALPTLAEQILGPYCDCDVARAILANPNVPQEALVNAREIFEVYPAARTDMALFAAHVDALHTVSQGA